MEDLVSVIITTYKRTPDIVRRAAQSVLSQTYKNIELIIIDDSPETYELRSKVRDMALSLGEKVKYIQHKENVGACAARNTGIKNAGGEYIAFLDDDDEWLPEKITIQKSKIEGADVAMVYCGNYICKSDGTKYIYRRVYKKEKIYNSLIFDNYIGSTSFPLIKKSVLDKLGGFDEQMPAAQDYELWLRIAKEYKIDYVEEPLVNYYIHDGEQITKNHKIKVEAWERLNEINMDYLKKHPRAYSKKIALIVALQAEFDIKEAKKNFWKAAMLWPLPTKDLIRAFKWTYIMPLLQTKR